MADDDANDSQALTGGDITRYRGLVARISCLSQDRPDLKFASMRVCCAMAIPSMRDMECVKRIGRYLVGKSRAKCWFRWQQSGDLEAYSDADWGGDRATQRSVSVGVILREATVSKCGPRSSRWWRCRLPRVSHMLQSRRPQKGSGSKAWRGTWEYPADWICTWMPRQRRAWSIAGNWARRSMLTCKTSGYRRLPRQAGSPRRRLARVRTRQT